MHAKRLLVLLLSAVLAACMLAGCDWLWWLQFVQLQPSQP